MTNGDRIRTFSDELLALTIICPVETVSVPDTSEMAKLYENGECLDHYGRCEKCCFNWLQQEEPQ